MTADKAPAPALRPGGSNREAFSVDRTTTLAEVFREVDGLVRRTGHKYTWEDYLALLDELQKPERYVVCPGREFKQTTAPDKVVVYMRHDIDVDPATALRMAEEEHRRGLRSSYYVLPTARYYGRQGPRGVARYAAMDELYRRIASFGHEIGVHNDLLAMMILWDADPLEFQRQELDYWREAGFDIVGVVSHGSGAVLSRKLNNTWIFAEFGKAGVYDHEGVAVPYGRLSLEDFGFQYEGYRMGQTAGTGDIRGLPTGRDLVAALAAFTPGERVSLLTHPIHWGEPAVPAAAAVPVPAPPAGTAAAP